MLKCFRLLALAYHIQSCEMFMWKLPLSSEVNVNSSKNHGSGQVSCSTHSAQCQGIEWFHELFHYSLLSYNLSYNFTLQCCDFGGNNTHKFYSKNNAMKKCSGDFMKLMDFSDDINDIVGWKVIQQRSGIFINGEICPGHIQFYAEVS